MLCSYVVVYDTFVSSTHVLNAQAESHATVVCYDVHCRSLALHRVVTVEQLDGMEDNRATQYNTIQYHIIQFIPYVMIYVVLLEHPEERRTGS